jgi:hypothetical protein
MLTEDFVSFETAKLLKEKGMDKSCFKHYVQKNNNDGTSEAVTVCTLQMAMKWLREVHNLFIMVDFGVGAYVWSVADMSNGNVILKVDTVAGSYEKAIESVIKYCSENLI